MDRRRRTFIVESNRELRRSTGGVFARVVLLGRVLCFMFVLSLSVLFAQEIRVAKLQVDVSVS